MNNICRVVDKPGFLGYERMNKDRFKIYKKSVPTYSSSEYTSPLVAIGACILSHSKIVLIDNLHFMLSHPHIS